MTSAIEPAQDGGRSLFWRSRIGRRLLVAIIAFSALVTLVISAFDLYVDYRVGDPEANTRYSDCLCSPAGRKPVEP